MTGTLTLVGKGFSNCFAVAWLICDSLCFRLNQLSIVLISKLVREFGARTTLFGKDNRTS